MPFIGTLLHYTFCITNGGAMKVYLSGKITGDSNYRQKFNSMENELLSYGYVVFNPVVLPDGFEYEEAKRLGLWILTEEDLRIRRTLVQLCRDSKRLAELVELFKGKIDKAA